MDTAQYLLNTTGYITKLPVFKSYLIVDFSQAQLFLKLDLGD